MGFSDECLKLFNTKDIYQIFHIKKTANNAESDFLIFFYYNIKCF